MKQVIVGTYEYGCGQAQLVLREGTGGEFYAVPGRGELPRIKVGADHRRWDEVVAVLMHEIFEFQMTCLGCRYGSLPDYAQDHSGYLFVMTHPQFSEIGARVTIFIAAALPDLACEWKKWKNPKRRKKK